VAVKALDGASLTVRSGEVMGIIGPTGCGKSTLLRAVAGLVPLQGGRILFDGVDQREIPTGERQIGMVFQDYALYPHYSVLDNLSFYFRLRHREDEVPARIKEAAAILDVDFELLLGRHPRTLSVGQRQQVAVARCLVRDPRIFLMDEPFASLDAQQRQRARLQVKRLLHRFRVTTLHVTHDQTEVVALCDRIAVMARGCMRQVDTYHNLVRWPVDLEVAEFIAEPHTQFVEGACLDEHFVCPDFQLPLIPAVRVRARPGQGLVAQIAPSVVALVEDASAGPEAIAGMVEGLEPMPMARSQRALCRVGVGVLPVELPADRQHQIGDTVRLRIDPDRVLVFDLATGANLSLGAGGRAL
jgi:ABC-type sugar transport system ATPase subunit